MADPNSFVVTVDLGPDADAEETERQTTQLRNELLQLDVDDVEHVSGGEAPEGTRAVELIALGSLLVKFGPDVINAVAGALQAWLGRASSRSITVQIGDRQIKLDGASDEERRKLVDSFLAANTAESGTDS
jgi:hypothetical protein